MTFLNYLGTLSHTLHPAMFSSQCVHIPLCHSLICVFIFLFIIGLSQIEYQLHGARALSAHCLLYSSILEHLCLAHRKGLNIHLMNEKLLSFPIFPSLPFLFCFLNELHILLLTLRFLILSSVTSRSFSIPLEHTSARRVNQWRGDRRRPSTSLMRIWKAFLLGVLTLALLGSLVTDPICPELYPQAGPDQPWAEKM